MTLLFKQFKYLDYTETCCFVFIPVLTFISAHSSAIPYVLSLANLISKLSLKGVKEISSLEITPSAHEVVLNLYTDFTLKCSGHNEVLWKTDNKHTKLDTVLEKRGTIFINTLTLRNLTGLNTGEYSCADNQVLDEKAIYIFVPDLSMPFLPSTQEDTFVFSTGYDEVIIPCRVTNPNATVALYEKRVNDPVPGMYFPQQGFKGQFEDKTYICKATIEDEEFESETFYVYNLQVSSSPTSLINISISAVQTILKQGENIIVTCTVRGIELIRYIWSYPGQMVGKEVKPATIIVPGHYTSSILTIHNADSNDQGLYACEATDTYHGQKEEQSIFIRVIERGFVTFHTVLNETVFAELHKSHTFLVQIEAYPSPTIIWFQNKKPLTSESNSDFAINSRNLSETRYQTTLTLVRVKASEGGLYTVRAFHEDDLKELSFYLQINVPATVTELKDSSNKTNGEQTVICTTEGMPQPEVTWYTCNNDKWCTGETTKILGNSSEEMNLQTNFTYEDDRKVYIVTSKLHFHRVDEPIFIQCAAQNLLGAHSQQITLVPYNLPFKVIIISVIVAFVVLMVLFLVILIFLWRKLFDLLFAAGRTLGSGAFGRVVEAIAHSLSHSQSTMRVAVKMLKCPIYIVTEYCRYGDLVDYLHRNKHTFLQCYSEKAKQEAELYGNGMRVDRLQSHTSISVESDGGYMDMSKDESLDYVPMSDMKGEIKYVDIDSSNYGTTYELDSYSPSGSEKVTLISESPLLSYIDLVGVSFQVAKGMEFLASKNQKYQQVNEEFLKSDHPAIVRIRPRNTGFSASRSTASDSVSSSSVLYAAVEQNGVDNDYIIPLPDLKPEADSNNPPEASSSRASSTLNEANTSSTISCDSPLGPEQEEEEQVSELKPDC
ncbi:hypothetical protein Chor_010979 [Crotalus horridus]